MKQRFKKLFIFCGAFFIFAPLFIFAQETSFVLKEKQAIDLVSIIRKFPLTQAQSDFFDQSLYDAGSDYSIKTGAVMLVKQTILQGELDYWFVKMGVEFSKRFIKAVYKILPAVTVGDFSGIISLIEKYTVEQANKYIDDWLKQNQMQIGSGIGKYSFPSYKNNWQTINIPYIIVYSPVGANKAKVVVEFYSKTAIEPPSLKGNVMCPESIADIPTSTCWPWDRWISSKYNKNGKIEPFIVRVKGQVVKDKYGNFSWDKNVVDIRYQPTVEVEFGKPVPEIDQSDIILKNLEANQSQGFIKDKINAIKQKAQGIVDQIKSFLNIFNSPKPTAQISDFAESAEETVKTSPLPLEDIAKKSQEIVDQADIIVNEGNATTVEQVVEIMKEQVEQKIQAIAPSTSSGQATSTGSTSSPQAICNQAINQEPDFDKVIFNEIAWMGDGRSASNEWIELKNISVRPLDLNGWQIFNKSQNLKILFTTTTIVEAGGFFLLERTNDDTVQGIKASRIYTGALANTDEMLYLVGPNCVLQDRITAMPYWPEGDNITKETMERNQFFGWQTSSVVGGTPKAKNSVGKTKQSSGGSIANVVGIRYQQQNSTSSASSTQQQATSTEQATTTQQATSTSSVQATSSPQVLIVEIQTESASSKSDDFIKLFNQSTSSAADISDWQLKKRTSGVSESSIKVFGNGLSIQPQSYFIWMNSDYALATTTKSDAITTQTISSNNSIALFNKAKEIVDQVAWGSSTNPFVEGTAFTENPSAGRNLIRIQDTGDNSVDFMLSTSSSQATTTQPENLLPAITNLMAIPSTVRGAVDLFWICPTTSSGYIIKKSEQEISASSWDTAQTISQTIVPKIAGEVEVLNIGNLPTDTKTFFAIKYLGLPYGTSSISNVVSATAWKGFTDNGDGIITDLRTGLAWFKDASSSVNNFGVSSTHDDAIAFMAEQTPWRLPNFKELASLFNYALNSPGVWSGFENIKPEKYWVKSKRLVNIFPNLYATWPFDFSNGKVEVSDYTYENGENSALYSFMATQNQGIPDGWENNVFDFTDNADGTVKDNRTGLMWLNSTLAQTIDNRKNWNSAFLFALNAVLCNDGTLQGNQSVVGDCSANGGVKYDDWRLPNVQELMEITKLSNGSVTQVLPNLSGNVSYYWTGSIFDDSKIWYVGDGYCFGSVSYRSKTGEEFNVQLVRDP